MPSFSRFTLLLRNLSYFRAANLAVIAGMAVATAVLTGALMVGDSVRGSLADLARRRLGPVALGLFSGRFFDESLAARLTGDDLKSVHIVPAILVHGGVANEQSPARDQESYR